MIGEIIQFAGITIPEGYLVCDGSAVSRSDYLDLFTLIGTTYGAGDGGTTFNLPDMSGRAGLGTNSTYTIGSAGGSSTVVIDISAMPSHSHEIQSHTHDNNISAQTPTLTHSITAQPAYNYTHLNGTAKRGLIGTGKNHFTGTSTQNMSLNSNLSIADHPATACTMSGGVLDFAAFDTESAGGGLAHNNMMPYLAVTYLIHAYIPVPVEPGMALYNGCCVVSAGGGYITGKT